MSTPETPPAVITDPDVFIGFPKIARLAREICVTEKIDGTNAQIRISNKGVIRAGSRTRWITPEDDNFGFARWVREHELELEALGPGSHFGEWWGCGIQRTYGLTEKRFSLFNTSLWSDPAVRPACCHVVTTLYSGPFDGRKIEECLEELQRRGSAVAPGFMRPEGIVIYHSAARQYFKKTLEKDAEPKGLAAAA